MQQSFNKVLMVIIASLLIGSQSVYSANPEKSPWHGATIQWVTPRVHAPRLQYRVFHSAAAKSKVSYHIYTPELYEMANERRFPVLYWLHGRAGGLKGLPSLVKHFDPAIRAGRMPPVLIIFPNGLVEGMWSDSKDGKMPIETILVKELVPRIDGTFRTIALRRARLIEGFSMGGFGAARLGFRYHDIFGAISMLGAGPLQQEFSASVGPKGSARARMRVLQTVYGGDQAYFESESPWVLAEQNAAAVRGTMRIRQVIGALDILLEFNRDFHQHLMRLGIPHTYTELPNVAHNPKAVLNALGERNWDFYRAVFSGKGPAEVHED